MKIIILISILLVFGIGVYVWQAEVGENEIYILPKNYHGVIFILYDQKNGEALKYEQGKRIYEIPQNGILKTQFAVNSGWTVLDKYFYKENGDLIKIPYAINVNDMKPDGVQICCASTGKSYFDESKKYVEFQQFYVGTKEEILKALENSEKTHPANLVEPK